MNSFCVVRDIYLDESSMLVIGLPIIFNLILPEQKEEQGTMAAQEE